jgi:predicted AlkP superfamily pyrophosphatase or phosphodiesterase
MVKMKVCFFMLTFCFVYQKGFRHGYLNTYSLPTLSRIQNEGIKTKHGMQPTFVTITFPNHISIATG